MNSEQRKMITPRLASHLCSWLAIRKVSHEKVLELAEPAKKIGVEMIVLDDGWFSGRAIVLLRIVYFRSSRRAQTAKKFFSAQKVGFPPIPERVPKSAENRTFCVKRAHFLPVKCGFPHFLALFLESAETPLFVQINVFAVWALRLDRKYTSFVVGSYFGN